MSESDDLDFDDILGEFDKKQKKKKPVKSGDKGRRGEKIVRDILKERFQQSFARTAGSGGRGGMDLPEHAKLSATGDLITPENFRFTIECKYGYDDVDIAKMVDGECKTLDAFLAQAQRDADRVGKVPLLCWKQTKQKSPWLAFVPEAFYRQHLPLTGTPVVFYKGWAGIGFNLLLAQPDAVFFY